MLSASDREKFAFEVMDEVRRWPGIELRSHASPTPGEADGVEFRLYGKQVGHLHGDCSVHVPFPKAFRETVVMEQLAEPLPYAAGSGWAMFNPAQLTDAERAIWLLRLNYVRLRRQRLTPSAAASSELLRHHEEELGPVSRTMKMLLERTQARTKPRPLPGFDAPLSSGLPGQSAMPPA